MGVNFGSAHYYTKQGNEYKKTNFFKKLGTLAGAAALIPAGMEVSKRMGGLGADVFTKCIKNGPGLLDHAFVDGINNKFLKNICEKGLKLMQKSKIARVGFVGGLLALAAGVYMGVGRLAGSLFDGVINSVKRHKADKRASV